MQLMQRKRVILSHSFNLHLIVRVTGRLKKCHRLARIVQRVETDCGCFGRFHVDGDAHRQDCVHSSMSRQCSLLCFYSRALHVGMFCPVSLE